MRNYEKSKTPTETAGVALRLNSLVVKSLSLVSGCKVKNKNRINKNSAKKMSKKVIGIDLGTGSIGLSLRNPELSNNIQDQLEWFSVTTFNSGTGTSQRGEYTLASDRRTHVQSRRLKDKI